MINYLFQINNTTYTEDYDTFHLVGKKAVHIRMQALNTRPFFTMYNIERTPIRLHKNAYKIQIKQKKTKFESPQALADSFTPTSCV